MDLEMRAIAPEEVGAYITTIMTGIARDPTEEFLCRIKPMIEFDRTLAVFDKGEIVGTTGAIPFEMTVPGGSLPIAGVTECVVLPTHRRRGIFTRLMERQLRDIHERGEALAALGASESIIYGRYGYGMAGFSESVRVWQARLVGRVGPQDASLGPVWGGNERLYPADARRLRTGRPPRRLLDLPHEYWRGAAEGV